jgi:hypothetical protein
MNRMMRVAAAAVAMAGGLGAVGCSTSLQDRWAGYVDPCWPERYGYEARQEVLAPFAAHVENGRIMDGTVFNFEFEQGTDKLSPGGMAKLDYLSRRRPAPDRVVYLQTARKLPATRADLDAKRAAAIQKYLAATTAGRGLVFDVTVLDPGDITFSAQGPANAARALPSRYGATAAATGSGGGGGGSASVTATTSGGGAATGSASGGSR